jgi:hypothetical protein
VITKEDAEQQEKLRAFLKREGRNIHPDKQQWVLPALNELIALNKKIKERREVTARIS